MRNKYQNGVKIKSKCVSSSFPLCRTTPYICLIKKNPFPLYLDIFVYSKAFSLSYIFSSMQIKEPQVTELCVVLLQPSLPQKCRQKLTSTVHSPCTVWEQLGEYEFWGVTPGVMTHVFRGNVTPRLGPP